MQFACLHSFHVRSQEEKLNSAAQVQTTVTAGSAQDSAFIFLYMAAHSSRMTATHPNVPPV